MEKVVLENIKIDNDVFDKLKVILDDNGDVVVLPLLFYIHLDVVGEVLKYERHEDSKKVVRKLVSSTVADTTVASYLDNVFSFLKHLNELHKSDASLPFNIHQTYLCKESTIRDYLNTTLPKTLSPASLGAHQASISAYFNFLSYINLREPHDIKITRKARQISARNNQKQTYIKYISSEERFEFLRRCTSLRDRLILKCGSEIGLRAAENRGLLVTKNGEKKGQLLELFEQLNKPEKKNITSFMYLLHGAYAKGGKSRNIFISRQLLEEFKRYYETERAEILNSSNVEDVEALFIKNDRRKPGFTISKTLPSDIFRRYLQHLPHIENKLSYHDLRHTFATELYNDLLKTESGKETRSESAALIEVAERLGHSLGRDGRPMATTTRYIRLREQMFIIEEGLL